MSDMPVVLRQKRGDIYWITIDRAQDRNALNPDVIAGISQGFIEAQDDRSVRAIVLTGAGDKAFCAGADLKGDRTFAFDTSRPSTDYANLLRVIRNSRLPSIARVNGACMAGGMGLLCATDMAIAVDSARFGLPEVQIGLFPVQVLALLKSLVPARTLFEWSLMGQTIDAEAVLRAGLVNYVVSADQLDAQVEKLTARLSSSSPAAITRGKYVLKHIADMSFDQGLAFAESQIPLVAMTEDAKEGLSAFREKRLPIWTVR